MRLGDVRVIASAGGGASSHHGQPADRARVVDGAGVARLNPPARRLMGMTETEARAALAAFVAVGEIERWIAEQPWEAVPGGWRVRGRFNGWRFRVEPAADGVRVFMSGIGGEPAAWVVPVRPGRAQPG
jgi:hypothetical protein